MLYENLFLIVLALIWIVIAIVQDFRKREVANWWNFSLIAIALAYRAFVSVAFWDYRFLVFGIAGFALFFLLANVFYYSRIFAGGDAKLLMALGAVLPFSSFILDNLLIFLYFTVLLLFFGGIYGLFYSFVLVFKNKENFVKEFKKQFKKNASLSVYSLVISLVFAVLIFVIDRSILLLLPLILLAFPLLYIYAKTIEESCMVKQLEIGKLTIGDWLYKNVKVGKKIIKPNWEGLDESELLLLKKLGMKKKVYVKEGIPFTPSFLFAFLALIWMIA